MDRLDVLAEISSLVYDKDVSAMHPKTECSLFRDIERGFISPLSRRERRKLKRSFARPRPFVYTPLYVITKRFNL